MFAMYDDDGLNFRSTIDHLYNLHHVTSSDKIKSATEREQQGSFKDSLYEGNITKEAKEKYKKVTNLDNKAEIFHVEQIMDHNVITVYDTKTVQECYNIMMEKGIQQLPIKDDTELHLKGMITLKGITEYLLENIDDAKNTMEKPISEISSKKIITTDPISDIRRVAKVMIDFHINAIPVVNSNDVIVGMVTRHDIVEAVSNLPQLQIWA